MSLSKQGRRILESCVDETSIISQELRKYCIQNTLGVFDIKDHCKIKIPKGTTEIYIEHFSISDKADIYFRDVFQQSTGIGKITMPYEDVLEFEKELNERLGVKPTVKTHTFH